MFPSVTLLHAHLRCGFHVMEGRGVRGHKSSAGAAVYERLQAFSSPPFVSEALYVANKHTVPLTPTT